MATRTGVRLYGHGTPILLNLAATTWGVGGLELSNQAKKDCFLDWWMGDNQ